MLLSLIINLVKVTEGSLMGLAGSEIEMHAPRNISPNDKLSNEFHVKPQCIIHPVFLGKPPTQLSPLIFLIRQLVMYTLTRILNRNLINFVETTKMITANNNKND